jgi:hypothetical protein
LVFEDWRSIGDKKIAIGMFAREGIPCFCADVCAVFFSQLGWYSTRVPAGDASAILQRDALDGLGLRIALGEFDRSWPTALDRRQRLAQFKCRNN